MTLTVSGEWNAKVRYLTRCFGLLGDRRSCFQGKSFGFFSLLYVLLTVAPPWESICFWTVQSVSPSSSQIKIFLILRYWSAWLEKRSPLFVYCLCCCQLLLWSDVNLLLMVLQWVAAVQHCTTVPGWSASTTMHKYTAGSFHKAEQ